MTTSPPVAQDTPRSECGRLSLSFVSISLLFLDSILLGGESLYSIYVQLAAPFSADLNILSSQYFLPHSCPFRAFSKRTINDEINWLLRRREEA